MNATTLRLTYLVSFGTLVLCLDYTYFQFWCGVVGLVCLGGSIIEMNWRKRKMKEIYWSTDDETYNLDSLEEVIEGLSFYNELTDIVGSEVSYGTAKPFGTDWVGASDVLEMIASRAYDEAGEWSENFPDVDGEAEEELQNFLSEWQSKHCVASFWRITHTKKYIITKEDVDKYLQENPQ